MLCPASLLVLGLFPIVFNDFRTKLDVQQKSSSILHCFISSAGVPHLTLEGGPNPHSGHVMVGGRPVCDEGWDALDGAVVCRQLGYYGLDRVTTRSRFGQVSSNFAMDDVHCSGDEKRLEDCPYNPSSTCLASEGAGVVCLPGLEKTFENVLGWLQVLFLSEAPNVSLVGGFSRGEGTVMFNGVPLGGEDWQGWDRAAGEVVCRELGFPGLVRIDHKSDFGTCDWVVMIFYWLNSDTAD